MRQITIDGVPARDEAEAWGIMAAAGVRPYNAVRDWNESTPAGQQRDYHVRGGGIMRVRLEVR